MRQTLGRARPPRRKAGAPWPTILLVEDDHDTRTLLTTALKEAGYAVVEAADGRQGLEVPAASPSI